MEERERETERETLGYYYVPSHCIHMCGWISSLPGLFLRDVPWVRMYASGLRILWPYLCAVCKPSHVCMKLFIHSLANYVISSAVIATADCCSAGSRLSQCGTCTSELFYRPLMSYGSFCTKIYKVWGFFFLPWEQSYFNWSVLLHRYFLFGGRLVSIKCDAHFWYFWRHHQLLPLFPRYYLHLEDKTESFAKCGFTSFQYKSCCCSCWICLHTTF